MRELDARGLICPLPVLKARKILLAMQPSEMLRVFVTDPASPPDFKLFCDGNGYTLQSVEEKDGVYAVIVVIPDVTSDVISGVISLGPSTK